MFYIIASVIIVASAICLAWIFAPAEDDVSKYSRRSVPGLDEHLKSKRFREEAESLRQIVNHHRAKERKKNKKSESEYLRKAIDKMREQRDFALGAAITPESVDGKWMFANQEFIIKDKITYKDWIHVYGGEKESS